MPEGKNYYQILQVDPSAEQEVITAAYKRLSIKYHPDLNHSSDANHRMQEINEAYQVLKDPSSRAYYDLYLNRGSSEADTGGGNGHQWENYPTPKQTATQPTGPQYALANFIVSLAFPVTYILLVFLMFRFFRTPNIIIILGVIIVSGLIASRVSASIQRYFRLHR